MEEKLIAITGRSGSKIEKLYAHVEFIFIMDDDVFFNRPFPSIHYLFYGEDAVILWCPVAVLAQLGWLSGWCLNNCDALLQLFRGCIISRD